MDGGRRRVYNSDYTSFQHGAVNSSRGGHTALLPGGEAELRSNENHQEVCRRLLLRQKSVPPSESSTAEL